MRALWRKSSERRSPFCRMACARRFAPSSERAEAGRREAEVEERLVVGERARNRRDARRAKGRRADVDLRRVRRMLEEGRNRLARERRALRPLAQRVAQRAVQIDGELVVAALVPAAEPLDKLLRRPSGAPRRAASSSSSGHASRAARPQRRPRSRASSASSR